ncbi:S-adenosylmethionine-dependent methyltransferase [Neobacillus notoginsengisoli]|uniref:S-adenosylmethionine-dependent methyltransferase n=1 Tax=Neobacillus notoginsengisoli TaxID=1578198 RepID=A0A417YXT3_9BACI|nr:SAM-dependent methyltransferase [Neobacillus notoginsengisoli]RHW42556.1 S-adenosylmethionine-dependent methyltransferase [Neobacillus notoginsengisoli]
MFTVKPVGRVCNSRKEVEDDFWGEVISEIEMNEILDGSCLEGIEEFSHLEIIFLFHLTPDDKILFGARRPRNNPDWPVTGIFAQRGKNRPNRIGATIVKLLKRDGTKLTVAGLDAVDGTPVIDIKPVMKEFLPKEEVKQPQWATELMEDYWK